MPAPVPHRSTANVHVRPAVAADLDALVALETKVFTTDRISRRSFRRFLATPTARITVAELDGRLAGYALVLHRAGSTLARLYSIAADPDVAVRGIGTRLLAAAETAARGHGASLMRLEVHEANARAISRYQKAGYHLFGRHHEYYGDKGHALRFEKRLQAAVGRRSQR